MNCAEIFSPLYGLLLDSNTTEMWQTDQSPVSRLSLKTK